MGFALWIQADHAIAQGTHEYRPMGSAVIGVDGIFTPRDFSRRRRAPSRMDPSLVGLFASLGEMNDWLKKRRPVVDATRRGKSLRRYPDVGPPIF